ncbi:MAG: IclR family transcriptional regulator [Verrucomicrobiae bacterium]|nr:IclR family transcriptional regulator [Verrucomicrobiae bacterium]
MGHRPVQRPAVAGRMSRYQVPNLERGLKILELLLDYPEGLTQREIAARLRCPATSVYRITLTLAAYGYVQRDEESKAVRLSPKLLAMGSRVLAEEDWLSVAMDAAKVLRDAVKETVLIGTLAGDAFVVLGQVLGAHPFKFSVDLGTHLPLHTAAPAKAMLAFLPEEERRRVLWKIKYEKFNERTLSNVQALQAELMQVARLGYAVDRQEQLTGIHCVAAPVLNRHGYPVAALWTTGPADRLRETDFPQVAAQVMAQARRVSQHLGFGWIAASGRSDGQGQHGHE